MRKLFTILAIVGMFVFAMPNVSAQNQSAPAKTEKVDNASKADQPSFHQVIKQRFVEGGPAFMGIILITLILGLAIAIERIIYLYLADTNTHKLLQEVESTMEDGSVEDALELLKTKRGPVASIFYQGLLRMHEGEGLEAAEKAVISYGNVQVGQLEKNITWLALFIALAPMFGFMGTIIGMIDAFDKIEKAGDMNPSLVAHGIKVALLTTLFGLIVAIILQIFYNFIIAKIDKIVNKMEDASISLIDILARNAAK